MVLGDKAGTKAAADGTLFERKAEKEKEVAEEAPAQDYSWIGAGFGTGNADYAGVTEPERIEQAKRQAVADKIQTGKDVRNARAEALGITAGALVSAKPMLEEMTADKYYSLSPRQRAAVDFNTALSTAVRKDKHRQDDYAEELKTDPQAKQERKTYSMAVEKMFGEEGGSKLYAPETVALLDQLRIKDTAADLDQYLGLKVAITAKDLRKIDDNSRNIEQLVTTPTPASTRNQVQQQLVDQTQKLQDTLAKGSVLLQNFQATAAKDREDVLDWFGGNSPKAGAPAPGFGNSEKDMWFRDAYDALADVRHRATRDQTYSGYKDFLTPQEFKEFESYVDARTANSVQYGVPVGEDKKTKYPSAQRYREILGLTPVNQGE
jgi:hypothetical protein